MNGPFFKRGTVAFFVDRCDARLECERCRRSEPINRHVRLDLFMAVWLTFAQHHQTCQPEDDGTRLARVRRYAVERRREALDQIALAALPFIIVAFVVVGLVY